jgi:hypothetical protein
MRRESKELELFLFLCGAQSDHVSTQQGYGYLPVSEEVNTI